MRPSTANRGHNVTINLSTGVFTSTKGLNSDMGKPFDLALGRSNPIVATASEWDALSALGRFGPSGSAITGGW